MCDPSPRPGWVSVLLLVSPATLVAAEKPIDLAAAQRCFEAARAISRADGGRLWGRELYGPLLFVDRASRAVVANEPDNAGNLQPQDGVYVGVLPDEVPVANTDTRWAGKHWTMLLWPLPTETHDRARLLAHEMWHRIQHDLGLPGTNPANVHLDRPDGRLWLRLEWRALSAALQTHGPDRETAVADALLFRKYRRSLFDGAAKEERALENNEGLAEYTGVTLTGWNDAQRSHNMQKNLRDAERADSYVRSFAYTSGPPWAMLLDDADDHWRRSYTADDDLGDRLAGALHLTSPSDLRAAAMKRMAVYGGEDVQKEEHQRDRRRQQRLQEARARYVDGPTLRIPLRRMQIEFDPNNLQPLDDIGTVYPTLRISDVWGLLKVTGGALVSADWTWVAVPVEAAWDGRIGHERSDWTLDLNQAWTLERAPRGGSWRAVERR